MIRVSTYRYIVGVEIVDDDNDVVLASESVDSEPETPLLGMANAAQAALRSLKIKVTSAENELRAMGLLP